MMAVLQSGSLRTMKLSLLLAAATAALAAVNVEAEDKTGMQSGELQITPDALLGAKTGYRSLRGHDDDDDDDDDGFDHDDDDDHAEGEYEYEVGEYEYEGGEGEYEYGACIPPPFLPIA